MRCRFMQRTRMAGGCLRGILCGMAACAGLRSNICTIIAAALRRKGRSDGESEKGDTGNHRSHFFRDGWIVSAQARRIPAGSLWLGHALILGGIGYTFVQSHAQVANRSHRRRGHRKHRHTACWSTPRAPRPSPPPPDGAPLNCPLHLAHDPRSGILGTPPLLAESRFWVLEPPAGVGPATC